MICCGLFFLSPPTPPVLCPRTCNLTAPFLPKVFIPLTSHLPFTAHLCTLAHPVSAFPVFTNPDTTPSTLPGFRLLPAEITSSYWSGILSQGSAPGADSGIDFTVSCAASLDHIVCGKLVLQAVLVSHLLHGHMLTTTIVTLNGGQCMGEVDELFLI